MLYEWRSYRFAPGRAVAYLRDFQSAGLPLVTRHLPLVGYWLTEAGRLNVLHHLWVYADLDDRAACRARLAADADWTEGFGPRAFPMIERQETLLLAALDEAPRLVAAVAAARTARPALAEDAPLLGPGWAVLETADAPGEPPEGAEPVGLWRVAWGERPGTCLRLSRADEAQGIAVQGTARRRELMRPTAFSPLA